MVVEPCVPSAVGFGPPSITPTRLEGFLLKCFLLLVLTSLFSLLKVGMIGSSAGGHLTATVLAYHDEGDANAADPIERQR